MPEKPKKRRLWEVDPSIFEPGHKASFFERHIVPPLQELGKFGLYALAITYPIYLVYVGLAFGGVAFWAFFAGSVAVIGLVVTRLGYASNFRHWDIDFKRTVGLLLGFPLAVGFYVGLIYLKTWLVPVAFVLSGLGLFFILRRSRS